ncbi:ChaN family lipoprotein [Phaeovulum sp.]|uniref:ChaN family lipoprotein n=1 Tax=Phaeovulum sp. TaxID=2934796 RepID=UPI0039E5F8D3
MKHLTLALLLLAFPAHAVEVTADALDTLSAEIVVLGEVHDNPAHHVNQARAVAALAPKALVFEMLTPDQAAQATPQLRAGDPVALGKALGWAEAGWPDFALYAPIFAAAPDALVVGGALARDDVRRAMSEGAAAVFGPEAARFGLTEPLPPALQSALEAEQMAAHCNALPAEMLPGMVEAQRLRDAAFARAALQALELTGGPVAVITGTGHARIDTGLPAVLRRVAPERSVLSLGQLERPATGPQPYDLWIVTDPAPREDPCLTFQK